MRQRSGGFQSNSFWTITRKYPTEKRIVRTPQIVEHLPRRSESLCSNSKFSPKESLETEN
jgi:hypothetical protein